MSEKQGGISNECELRNILNISVENILTGTIETISRIPSITLTNKRALGVITTGITIARV